MTPKQQRFVDEYLIDLNATQAAIRAGYAAKTAEQQGYQLLQYTSVAAAIANRIEKRCAETAIDAAWVLREAKDLYMAARAADRLPAALKALEIVGKHVDVQAFREQVDHRLAMTAEEARGIVSRLLPKHGPSIGAPEPKRQR